MIQFKKIPLGKSAIILLLFLTTSTIGFLRNNEDEHRTTRDDGNLREIILSMDRREENIQVQNLPIRKLDINRQINEKDSIAERLYDRRSFRTGTIERGSQNIRSLDRQHNEQNREISIGTNRASRNIRKDGRDVNNNRRDNALNIRQDRRSFVSNILRENRRFTEQAVISRNRQSDAERRLLNIRTGDRKIERRVVRERDIRDARSNSNARQTRDQIRRTTDFQRRSVDLTTRNIPETRVAERQELLNRQIQNRRTTNRESNQRQTDNRRSIDQRRSIRENGRYSSRREVLNRVQSPQDTSRRLLEDRRFTVRFSENQGRISSEAGIEDQTRSSMRQSTERVQRSVSRDTRDVIEKPGVNASDRRSRQISIDNTARQIRTRELFERDHTESRSSTRSRENQQRFIGRRNTEQIRSLEGRRFGTVRALENQERRSSEARLLDRQRSTERLERRVSRDTRNILGMPGFNAVERSREANMLTRLTRDNIESRQRSIERRSTEQSRLSDRLRSTPRVERGISRQDYTRRNSIQERNIDQRRQRSADRRENQDSARYVRDSRSDSIRNIKDNTQIRRNNSVSNRLDSSRLSHEHQRNHYSRQRLNVSKKDEHVATDRYNQLTADSRRFFETLVSQRTTRARVTERVALEPVRHVDHVDTNMLVNTAKIILAAFLIGQIFVNSSKQNKFRFHNILSMATSVKEKIQ